MAIRVRVPRWHICVACLVAVAGAIGSTSGGSTASQRSASPQESAASRASAESQASQRVTFMVEPGTPSEAEVYYLETFDALGITATGPGILAGDPSMTTLLSFLGYPALDPKQLEDTKSDVLMQQHGPDVTVSAFFAPKITDVSKTVSPQINVGWRKVVRLRSKAGSGAIGKGITSAWLLFNKFQGTDYTVDPLEPRKDGSNESKTTQLILVRAADATGTGVLSRPLHFFVFGEASKGAKLKLALQASFDAAAPEIEASARPNPIRDYYVPVACGQCHGGLVVDFETDIKSVDYPKQKLNFLDTDHWFDRVKPGDDFDFLHGSSFGVLYDGGPDQATPKFAKAFDVIRTLNTEIKQQNELTEGTPARNSFQYRAVSRWLDLHANADDTHKGVFARALPPLAGAGPAWNAGAAPDQDLLPLMNRYCYRCHSSVAYGVFDRPEVACRKPKITSYLQKQIGDRKYMPQDRVLDAQVRKTFLDLVAALPNGVACAK